jgi:uncharacterized protein YbaP (TraB family)
VGFLFYCRQKQAFSTAINNKSLLWEISGNGLPQPSYFLGTMHLMCADDAVLSTNTKAVIRQVSQVYLEVDMDNMGELLNGVLDLNMKDDKVLEDLLPRYEYEKVKSFFQYHQPSLPFSILERQQPMMLASSLYELFLTCEKKNGIDIRVIEEAAKRKKETKGLESMAFQTSVLDSIPYEEQAEELASTIDNIDKYKAALDELVKAYKLQDVDYLHELSTKEESGVGNHLDLLLYDRNKRWADQFEVISKQKSTLYAVGAGHLGGEQGVINLLKQKGYTVRAIEN